MDELTTLYNQAEKLKDEGKNEEAIALLKELLEKDESHTLPHLALAVLYYKTSDFEKSVAHGQRACEIEPNEAFNFTAMSVTYQRAFAGTQDQSYIQKAEDAMAKAHALEGR